MFRPTVVCLVISCAWSTACMVGNPDPGYVIDAGSGDEPDADGDPNPDALQAACEPAATVLPNGNHNPGLACLTCHDGNTLGAPTWTLAGTLYTNAAGAAPVSGATITVIDAAATEHQLITAANGNFYTSLPIVFPVRVEASKCPDTRAMGGQPAIGDCNSCHANGGQGRIHLP